MNNKTMAMADLLKVEWAGGVLTNPGWNSGKYVFDTINPADEETREFLMAFQEFSIATTKFNKILAEKMEKYHDVIPQHN